MAGQRAVIWFLVFFSWKPLHAAGQNPLVSLSTKEDLSLEVSPCAPGFYCDPSSAPEPCVEGSQHVVFENADGSEQFAVCSTSFLRSSADGLDASLGLDLSFQVHLPLLEGVSPTEDPNFLDALHIQTDGWETVDISFQEYLALEVTDAPPGCNSSSNTQLADNHDVILWVVDNCRDSLCEPGTWSSGSACVVCALGYSCQGQNHPPEACPAGTYAPIQGLSACLACPALSHAQEGASSFEEACALPDFDWGTPLMVPPGEVPDSSLAEMIRWMASFYGVAPSSILVLNAYDGI